MKSEFDIMNIKWGAVAIISAISFIFGFTFFDKWIAVGIMATTIIISSIVSGFSKYGRVTKIINVTPREEESRDIIEREDFKND